MAKLKALLALLDGKKSYLGSIALGILGLLWSAGYISDKTAEAAGALLVAWTGVSIRSAISKSGGTQ